MRRAILGATIAFALGVLPSAAQTAPSRILKLDELRFPQVEALDRERTMFVLPIGMLEEHGPHLADRGGHDWRDAGLENERTFEAKLDAWLARRKKQ